jgi:hypothetical protein
VLAWSTAWRLKHQFGFVGVKMDEDVVLVFEIEINGAVGHPRLPRDLGNRRLVKPLFGKYLDGGGQYFLVLIRITFHTNSFVDVLNNHE